MKLSDFRAGVAGVEFTYGEGRLRWRFRDTVAGVLEEGDGIHDHWTETEYIPVALALRDDLREVQEEVRDEAK